MPQEEKMVKILTERIYDKNTNEKAWGWRVDTIVVGDDADNKELREYFSKRSIQVNTFFSYQSREEAEDELKKAKNIIKDHIILWRALREAVSVWTGTEQEVI